MPLLELLLILLITLGFSIAVVFAKVSLKQMMPERFSMIYSMGATTVIFIEFSIFHSLGRAPIAIGGSVWILILSAIFGAFAFFSGYVGLKKNTAGVSSTIFDMQGPMIVFIGALAFSIYPGNMVTLGIIVAVVGLFVMGFGRDGLGKIRFTLPFVILCAAPVLWALQWIVFSFISAPAPIFLTFVLYLSIFLVLAVLNLVFRRRVISSLRARGMALVGGFFSGIANGTYGVFITTYGSTLTGIITLISVPVALILVILILKETYNRKEIAGIGLVCLGLFVSMVL